MTNSKIESDIEYVKELVSKSEDAASPSSIYVLWAILIAIGFSMVDFAPRWVGFFWMIAGPAGGLFSGYLGCKAGANNGQMDRENGIKHALHWSGMLVFIFLAVLLGIMGIVQGVLISQIILLIVALGWWTAGVHFDRNFLWLGGLMALGFLGTVFLDKYAWTAMGILLGVALIIIAMRKGRENASQSE